MLDAFRFLSSATKGAVSSSSGGSNAAQDFLAKQMAKNKFLDTAQPIENVGKHTTTDPYAYGEGSVPGGEGYKDQQTVLNQKEIDAWHAANPDYKEGGSGGPGDWSKAGLGGNGLKRYKQGMWGAGDLSAEEIREKFGLSDDESAASGERAIYGYNKDGSKVFIGAVTGDLTGNSELVSAHSRQNLGNEIDHTGGSLSSDGDVKGAILNLWKADDGEGEVEGPPKPKMGIKPIEHSQEIRQAKERVKTFEQDMESGKMSKENFGNSNLLGQYSSDSSTGAEGIGTNAASSGQESANSATQSFLDNKVSQVKKTLSPA